MAEPLISIVTAAYNRSNALRLALAAAGRQTLADWELLVVGDGCGDDAAAAVAAGGDARVSFRNLPRHGGCQSGPNNEGCRLARGRYLAFLNHDDLWLPDHLETARQALEREGADLVFTLTLVVGPDGCRRLCGAAPAAGYAPWVTAPASSWLFRRELLARVGPWRHFSACHNSPSQDWLFRAWKSGARLAAAPRLTVVALPAGMRRAAYAGGDGGELEEWARRLREEPDFRERELTALAAGYAQAELAPRVWDHFGRGLRNAGRRLALACGGHPLAWGNFLRYRGRRGGFVAELRRREGLAPRPPARPGEAENARPGT